MNNLLKIFCAVIIFLFECNCAIPNVFPDCTCGEANLGNPGRIVNGRTTNPHKYPWMAGMFTERGSFSCGGAIISNRNILTAGHCIFYSPSPLRTFWVLGMHTVRSTDGITFRVSKFSLHPYFVNSTMYDNYDVAIVQVNHQIEFSDTIRPICLPVPNDDFSGKRATVAGWGRLNEGSDAHMAKSLQEARIWIKTVAECTKMTEKMLVYDPDSMVCGHEINTDACQGDSGGPLFIETDPNRYEIFGVVSFGDGCARDFPGIYGRIADEYTLKWIKKFIADSDANVCSDTALRLDGKFYADF